MTGQVTSVGCKLLKGDGASPEVFTSIGHLIDFDGPQFSSAEQEVTDGDSTGREYLPQIPDPGQLSFNMHKVPGLTTQDALLADVQNIAQPLANYRLQPTTSATNYFFGAAFVRDLRFTGGAGGGGVPYTMAGALRLSGAWDEAYS